MAGKIFPPLFPYSSVRYAGVFHFCSIVIEHKLPDFMEKGGIPLPNGQIVYLDPNNPDTDGDGIPDGDEIALKIQIVDWDSAHNPIYGLTGYIFRSNPASNDSDGDGIEDKDDERAFAKDTIETMFKLSEKNSPRNPTYIEIKGNDITVTTYINFSGDADKIFPGTNKTYAQVAAEGIESIWTTTFSGGKLGGVVYDFVPGLKGSVTTKVYYALSSIPFSVRGNQKYLSVRIYDQAGISRSGSHNPFWSWSLADPGIIEMYSDDSRNNNPPYTEAEYRFVAAHEFGHTLGLSDAYPAANDGNKIINNAEIGRDGIMYSNIAAVIYSNDIEMILESFSVNQKQYYFGENKSRVIRLPQVFEDVSQR